MRRLFHWLIDPFRSLGGYEHKLVWGNDRRAQGPLELRRNNTTSVVEWRYNGSNWSADSIPAEISALFDEGGRG